MVSVLEHNYGPITYRGFSFLSSQPRLCALLRSKVFPHSPFSDASDADTDTEFGPERSSRKRSQVPSTAKAPPARRPRKAVRVGASAGDRSSSRALSESLEEERTLRRSASVGGAASKRVLSREVSMTRVFRDRAPTPTSVAAGLPAKGAKKANPAPVKAQPKTKARAEGVTLVEATPTKAVKRRPAGMDATLPSLLDGVLVTDTPTKPQIKRK
jgi:hypothetical protein